MTPDFSRIYAELGLQPGCSLDEFQRAYRQCLSERHPDRARSTATPADAVPLSDLIALHSSAMAFHREHGRLPGGTTTANALPVSRVRHNPSLLMGEQADRSTFTRKLIASALIAGLLLAGLVNERKDMPPPAAALRVDSAPVAERATSAELLGGPLQLGMDAATVRLIQGEPMRINGGTWEYGPSWLRFEDGELVDWYSSPLYRLKTPTSSPGIDSQSSRPYKR